MTSVGDTPRPSNSLTLRVRIPNAPGLLSKVTGAIGKAGASIGAIDLVEASDEYLVRDIVVNPSGETQSKRVVDLVEKVKRVELVHASDRTFLLHLGGKIEVVSRSPIKTRDDLSMAYTPGVERVCEAIAADPENAWKLTMKRRTVAIVTDGSAVLGLGNVGPAAALPVMEGKAQLFKEFGDINAFPLCLDTQDSGEIIEAVTRIAPGFGAVNLEDIAAPRCFEIQEKLQALLDIPVFHDDQDGTAAVVLAGLINAVKVAKKKLKNLKVVISGVGASGVGVTRLLLNAGIKDVVGCDREGAIFRGRRENMNPMKEWYAENTNPRGIKGPIKNALKGADVFIGLSAPGVVSASDLKRMGKSPIVFALANPVPEVRPEKLGFASVIGTGRSDYPNQINNALAFPGILLGCLNVRASRITPGMLVAAAEAIAAAIPDKTLQADYIVPSIFDRSVARMVAAAVAREAKRSRISRRSPKAPVDALNS
jgi:malate dehydrogenase (oxaloacetate-decarboxylating)